MGKVKILIAGCGGLGKEVLWTANRIIRSDDFNKIEVMGFCSIVPEPGRTSIYGLPFFGVPRAGWFDSTTTKPTHFICAVGNNKERKELAGRLEGLNLKPHSIIDPSALLAEDVSVGEGSYIAAGSILSVAARIGGHVIINLHATVGHDCILDDFAHICPGARLSGRANIGEGAFVGSNAVVNPGVHAGPWSTLGSASMANRDVPQGATAVGVPARVIWPPTGTQREESQSSNKERE